MKNSEERIKYCLDWISKIDESGGTIKESRQKALQAYRSDHEIVPSLKGRSKATTTDMMDIVEWLKPSLLELFTSSNEIAKITAAGEEDYNDVHKLNKLVNYQIKVRNNWFITCHDMIDDALKFDIGILKYQWFKETKTFDKIYEGLTDQEYQAKLTETNITEIKHEIIPTGEIVLHNVTFRYFLHDSYPLIEAVPPEEFGFYYISRNIKDAFCYHKVKIPKWKFIRDYGQETFSEIEYYKNQEKTSDSLGNERFYDLGGKDFLYNEEEDSYNIYECYYDDPETGEPWITKICGEKELLSETNVYQCPPFIVATPIRVAHRIIGLGVYELTKEIQKIRTSVMRGILNNINTLNSRRYFGDPSRFNVKDYLENNAPDALIRTYGPPTGAVEPEIKTPLPGEVFAFWEMLEREKDYHSGVPRSFQGVTSSSLHKTFRGQAQQINQATQRVSMMARIIAEQAIVPLIQAVIDLNIRFLDKETTFRYLNEDITINPDNLLGKYDIIVNIGTGTGDKEQTILYMQQLLGLYRDLSMAGVPVANAQDVYNAMKELISAMDKKNVHDFCTDPEFNKGVMALVQVVMALGIPQQDPNVASLVQQIMVGLGVGLHGGTTQASEQPAQPFEPVQPQTTPMGGGYFG